MKRILLIACCSLALVSMGSLTGYAQSTEPSDWTATRTPDGHPDLQGVWDYRSMTPLERPRDLADKAFFTAEEAAAYERESVARRDKDRRTEDGLSAQADVAAAYNEFWWDYGKKLSDLRTSLVVDPPDGRIPALTAAATAAGSGVSRSLGAVSHTGCAATVWRLQQQFPTVSGGRPRSHPE